MVGCVSPQLLKTNEEGPGEEARAVALAPFSLFYLGRFPPICKAVTQKEQPDSRTEPVDSISNKARKQGISSMNLRWDRPQQAQNLQEEREGSEGA